MNVHLVTGGRNVSLSFALLSQQNLESFAYLRILRDICRKTWPSSSKMSLALLLSLGRVPL